MWQRMTGFAIACSAVGCAVDPLVDDEDTERLIRALRAQVVSDLQKHGEPLESGILLDREGRLGWVSMSDCGPLRSSEEDRASAPAPAFDDLERELVRRSRCLAYANVRESGNATNRDLVVNYEDRSGRAFEARIRIVADSEGRPSLSEPVTTPRKPDLFPSNR